MSDKKILFFTFGREKSEILHQSNTGNTDEQLSKSRTVKQQLISIELSHEEQQKITTTKSFWYCKFDSNNIYYLLEVDRSYPERCAYQFIAEVQAHIKQLNNIEEADDPDIKFHCKKKVQELIQKYDDLAQVDKISQAQANLNDVKVEMQDNIQKMVGNTEQLDNLQGKSSALQKQSQSMKKQSKDLERLMYWRNMKLKIILVVIIFCIALLIIIPLAGGLADDLGDDDKRRRRVLSGFLPQIQDSNNNNSNYFDEEPELY